MKNSTELIAMASEIVKREMERSIEKEKQPSFYECIYEAYMNGLEDATGISADTLKKAQDWHYIELEGNPDDDEKYWCLCQYDGYRECEKGWFDIENKIWHIDWEGRGFKGVVAWHKLPYEE